MARGIIRKPSFGKIVGAYRSQWKRFWLHLFTFGAYGSRGMGWFRDPKKAAYNWWYNRTSISVYRLFGGKASRGSCFFACLCASIFSIFASPVDATRAGVKAYKIKQTRKQRAESSGRTTGTSSLHGTRTTTDSTARTTYSSSNKCPSSEHITPREETPTKTTSSSPRTTSSTSRNTTEKKPNEKKIIPTYTAPVVDSTEYEAPQTQYTYTPLFEHKPIEVNSVEPEIPQEPDENTPKSTPKHEKDQYIRKRMTIAGSSYCDSNVLSRLKIGTYFDLEAEPDNPYDKDAVKLVYEGEKIGYIAKTDHLAFVTCLKLRRNIYGVITNIIDESGKTKYEFETWFDSGK